MRFWDTVELLPASTNTDALGTPVKRPAESGSESPAVVQPLPSDEQAAAGQHIVSRYLCFLPPDAVLDGWSYVRWNGHDYEVDGDPAQHSGSRGIHHIEAILRRVR